VVAGMARQGYDLELRRYDGAGWRAIFFQSGFEHSLTSHAGTAWARSPWAAVQRAAGDALRKLESPDAAPRDWCPSPKPHPIQWTTADALAAGRGTVRRL